MQRVPRSVPALFQGMGKGRWNFIHGAGIPANELDSQALISTMGEPSTHHQPENQAPQDQLEDMHSKTPSGLSRGLSGTLDGEVRSLSICEVVSPISSSSQASMPGEVITGQKSLVLHDGSELYGTEYDIHGDAYGAALVAATRNLTILNLKWESGKEINWTVMEMTVVMLVLLCLNGMMQLGILAYLDEYVVKTNVHMVQEIFLEFTQTFFNSSGDFQIDKWRNMIRPGKNNDLPDRVCGITMWNKSFYYAILFLWALTNLQEFRNIDRLVRQIWVMPSCKTGKEMLLFTEQFGTFGGECHIMALTRVMRFFILIGVCLPRIVIAVWLLLLGWRWLSATHSFEDMVLNSLALEFIINIDDLLYHSVLPLAARNLVERTKFFNKQEPKSFTVVERDSQVGIVRTFIWLTLIVVFMVIYGELFQDVLPPDLSLIRTACTKFREKHYQPVCQKRAYSLWHSTQECYSVGSGLVDNHTHAYGLRNSLRR